MVRENSNSDDKHVKMGVSGIIAIIFIITFVSGLTAWIFYAYVNPHTTSGQILIRVNALYSVIIYRYVYDVNDL